MKGLRKLGIKSIATLVVVAIMAIFTFTPSGIKAASSVGSNQIIGAASEAVESERSDFKVKLSGNVLANYIIVDWEATETHLYLYITNIGVDSVDAISATVVVDNKTKNFSYKKVSPGGHTYNLRIPIQQCHEDISVCVIATDGGDTIASTTCSGSRNIPSNLKNKWSKGGRSSKAACLNYHYKTHGSEVNATNICAYVRLADNFRNKVLNENIPYYKKVAGATPNVYRFRTESRFVDAVCPQKKPTGDLVSFGGR